MNKKTASMILKSDAAKNAKILKTYWLNNTWEYSILNEKDEEDVHMDKEPVASVYERRRQLKVVTEGTTGSSTPSSERVDESIYIVLRECLDQIDWMTTRLCRFVFQSLDVFGVRFCKTRGY